MKTYNIYIDNLCHSGPGNALLAFIDQLLSDNYDINILYHGQRDPKFLVSQRVKITKINDYHPTFFSKLTLPLRIKRRKMQNKNVVNVVWSFISIGVMDHILKSDGQCVFVLHANMHNLIELHQKNDRFWFKSNLYFLRYADDVVCVSESVKQSLSGTVKLSSKTKIHAIYNMCRISELNRMINEALVHPLKSSGSLITLCYVGRLIPTKGLELLIDSIPLVKAKHNVRLILVGDGSDEYLGILKQKVADYQLEHDVVFAGHQENPMLFLLNSDIFVFPTISEGLPIVLIEALYASCKIIASDVEGCRDLLRHEGHEYGLLVNRTKEAFAAGIEKIICCETNFDQFDFKKYNEIEFNKWKAL